MEEETQYNRQEKEREKKELLRALAVLELRTSRGWSPLTTTTRTGSYYIAPAQEQTRYTYPQILQHALSSEADSSVEIIATLHREKKLKSYIEELKAEKKLSKPVSLGENGDIEISQGLITNLLNIATPESTASVVPYRARTSNAAFFSTPSKGTKSSAMVAGAGFGGLVGLILLTGGIATAISLLTKSAAVTAAAATAAAAGAAFPPIAIALISIGAALALTALILVAVNVISNIAGGMHFRSQAQMQAGKI